MRFADAALGHGTIRPRDYVADFAQLFVLQSRAAKRSEPSKRASRCCVGLLSNLLNEISIVFQ